MELRIPTPEQLRTVYDRDLRTAFPAAELKPLKNMEEMWAEGRYRPWCLFDGDDIAGEAFLWLGLEKLREAERGNVIFGESEIPCYAPDPAMAERRLGFYARNGARTAGYDTEMFGVPYKTLYWADGKVDESALMEEHRFVYASTFAPDKFRRYVRIPFDPNGTPGERVSWQQ